MQDLRKQEDERSREHWAFVESVANKVGNWPLWKQAATLTAWTSIRRQKRARKCPMCETPLVNGHCPNRYD
jgi:hypothetical protein